MLKFNLQSNFKPVGDQPEAIAELIKGIEENERLIRSLLGATGTGKTFSMAHVIQTLQRPVLLWHITKL